MRRELTTVAPRSTIEAVVALPFIKVEGLGNDFLLLAREDQRAESLEAELTRLAGAAPRLCDRRLGVGGDGLLVVCAPSDATCIARMIVVNHDGSRPEMCGNGLRCVAHHIALRTGKHSFVVETDAGSMKCEVDPPTGQEQPARVLVDMGPPVLLGESHPRGGRGRRFLGVSMGNPHAVHFVEGDEDLEALAHELGPQIEVDPLYPDRTNVEFARIEADGIRLWVWERGCGITGACGTGACATVAAAVSEGLAQAERPIRVALPGGELEITQREDGRIGMRGPSRQSFTGVAQI
jgi:diaminopimelate epimerase